MTSVRERDNGGGEHKQRSIYEKYKTIMVLAAALTSGSVAGVGVKFYNTNEVNATPARVEVLENRVSDYMSSQAREAALNQLLLKQSLVNIGDDLKEMKAADALLQVKLDALTRLIRTGHATPP